MKRCLLFLCGLFLSTALLADTPLSQDPAISSFIDHMVVTYHCNRQQLQNWFDQTKIQEIISTRSGTAYEQKPWYQYRDFFLIPDRITQGVAFWHKYQASLARAAKIYGVPPEIIVAIIGVESNYGTVLGKYRVMDALATLGFGGSGRNQFFQNELSQYILYCIQNHQDPLSLYGSYAGAMGQPQFMPSSIQRYAVDFDHDGKIDIIHDTVDVIGSVANYFQKHGWTSGEPIAELAELQKQHSQWILDHPHVTTLARFKNLGIVSTIPLPLTLSANLLPLQGAQGTEYWLVFHNFKVIMTYNNSQNYALAVTLLAKAIKARYTQTLKPNTKL